MSCSGFDGCGEMIEEHVQRVAVQDEMVRILRAQLASWLFDRSVLEPMLEAGHILLKVITKGQQKGWVSWLHCSHYVFLTCDEQGCCEGLNKPNYVKLIDTVCNQVHV